MRNRKVEFGQLIRKLMASSGLTQKEVLEALGYSSTRSVRRLQEGTRKPGRDALIKFAVRCGQNDPRKIDEVLEGFGYGLLSPEEQLAHLGPSFLQNYMAHLALELVDVEQHPETSKSPVKVGCWRAGTRLLIDFRVRLIGSLFGGLGDKGSPDTRLVVPNTLYGVKWRVQSWRIPQIAVTSSPGDWNSAGTWIPPGLDWISAHKLFTFGLDCFNSTDEVEFGIECMAHDATGKDLVGFTGELLLKGLPDGFINLAWRLVDDIVPCLRPGSEPRQMRTVEFRVICDSPDRSHLDSGLMFRIVLWHFGEHTYRIAEHLRTGETDLDLQKKELFAEIYRRNNPGII
jgi:transcriptional regulator with XRE-family HTH domain